MPRGPMLAVGAAALAAAGFLLAAMPLGARNAALPNGNIVLNPGFEEGQGSTDGHFVAGSLPRWHRPDSSTGFTAVRYGATGFLYMDANERLLDGSPNPFFLRPYVGFWNSKGVSGGPSLRETYRAQLAYQLDLRQETSLLRWLGNAKPDYYAYVREYWRGNLFHRQKELLSFDAFWEKSLQDGVVVLGDKTAAGAPALRGSGD